MGVVQMAGSLLSGVAAIASLVAAVVVLRIKLEVQELRTDIERERRKDEEKIQGWVEQRFVRRAQQI